MKWTSTGRRERRRLEMGGSSSTLRTAAEGNGAAAFGVAGVLVEFEEGTAELDGGVAAVAGANDEAGDGDVVLLLGAGAGADGGGGGGGTVAFPKISAGRSTALMAKTVRGKSVA